jgi:hypothetical protein
VDLCTVIDDRWVTSVQLRTKRINYHTAECWIHAVQANFRLVCGLSEAQSLLRDNAKYASNQFPDGIFEAAIGASVGGAQLAVMVEGYYHSAF